MIPELIKEDPAKTLLKKLAACLRPIIEASGNPILTEKLTKIVAMIDNMEADTLEKAHNLASSVVVLLLCTMKDYGIDLMDPKYKRFNKFCAEKLKPTKLYLSDSVRSEFYGQKQEPKPTRQKSMGNGGYKS